MHFHPPLQRCIPLSITKASNVRGLRYNQLTLVHLRNSLYSSITVHSFESSSVFSFANHKKPIYTIRSISKYPQLYNQ
ncbi:unnamed protein product, partial [Heterobilharzia americana]